MIFMEILELDCYAVPALHVPPYRNPLHNCLAFDRRTYTNDINDINEGDTPLPPCVLRTALFWHCVLRTAIFWPRVLRTV